MVVVGKAFIFAYMKVVLTTLNAKYIHTSLALRWLYVANKDRFNISFREYVIKEDVSAVANDLLSADPDVIGISVSIWNVVKTESLIRLLKQQKPELILIIGGPEVSYEPAYFICNWPVDYVISGEGEFVLGQLLSAIQTTDNQAIESVSSRQYISNIQAKADIDRLVTLPSPYLLEEDGAERKNRLVYFETSRGCPYQCQYCLSSLERGVRYFPQSYIEENLNGLFKQGVQQVKFLDRTFNLNKKHTRSVFDFLIRNYQPGISCQFEIYADLLDDEMIGYLNEQLPPHYFRFEIGIQSTYDPTNETVKRKQNFTLLAGNIRKLMAGGKIDLHLDLIAGLPHETFDRFRQSFDDVFGLKAKEVQLGFLKMLRGTVLRRDADRYGYIYDEQAPYEIHSNSVISAAELSRIHDAEHALEKYWNSGKFTHTMEKLFATSYKDTHFNLFDQIGLYYREQQLPHHGYHLEDVFRNLHQFLLSKGIDLFDELRTDYYSCFKIRPHGFWPHPMAKKLRKQLLYRIGNDKAFLEKHNLTRKIIEKQAVIDPLGTDKYLLTIFCADGSRENPLFLEYNDVSVAAYSLPLSFNND